MNMISLFYCTIVYIRDSMVKEQLMQKNVCLYYSCIISKKERKENESVVSAYFT